MIPYGQQWIDEDDIAAVLHTLKGDWMTQGPKVDEFEKAVADFCGATYGVAVSSGTAALHSAYAVAGINVGDEVIMSPLTFSATASAVTFCGGRPIFVDIDEQTFNIDPGAIEQKITSKTKAIAPVDFAGHPCAYDRIVEIAKQHNLFVIEDASHALGATYQGVRVGSFADMTILSFHPVKHIATGEGGMILTNRADWYEALRAFRHHGIIRKPEQGGWYYEIEKPGNNYRITDLQCALGLSQLAKLEKFIARRRAIVARYNEAFRDLEEMTVSAQESSVQSSHHIYVVQLCLEHLKASRREIFDALRARGIGVQVHYMPLHLHPFYANTFGYKRGDFPKAEQYYERALTLPLFPKMTDKDVERVIETVRSVVSEYSR